MVAVGVPVAVLVLFARNPPLGVFLNGIVVGSLYGAAAVGLVLVYRANRIISFAQAGLGAFPAGAALLLHTEHGWPYPAVVVVAVGGSLALGGLVELALIRRFRDAPRLILTVATIGVAQLLAFLELQSSTRLSGDMLPGADIDTPFSGLRRSIGGVVFRGDHLVAVLSVMVVAVALGVFLRRTDVGVAVRAAAENRDRALLAGVPVARLSTVVWMIAGLLSGLGVFLRGPLVGLSPGGLVGPEILLFALAAAVVGRFENVWTTLAAGVALGVFDQCAFYATRNASVPNALVLPLILGALLLQRKRLSRAEDAGASSWQAVRTVLPVPERLRRLPEVRVARLVLGAGLGLVLVTAPWLVGELHHNDASQVLLYGIVGISLVMLTGWAGQISLGQVAFTGIGAVVAGSLAAKADADFFVAVAVGTMVGAGLSVLVGLPALRIQGLFLAVSSLAFASATSSYFLNRDYFSWLVPDLGETVDRPPLYGIVDLAGDHAYYYVCLAAFVAAALMARALRASRPGRVMIATRDNPRAAQAYGINVARTRLATFAISGMLAALAGTLFVYLGRAVDPGNFFTTRSIDVFAMVVIGGLGSVAGALAGAVYVIGVQEFLPDLELLATGAGMLLLLLFFPGGLAELGFRGRDAFVRWAARRHGFSDYDLQWARNQPETTAATASGTTGAHALAAATLQAAGTAVINGSEHQQQEGDPPTILRPLGPDLSGALLRCHDLSVGYDHVQVLFGVDLSVHQGEIVALLGTNGAGKSTLLKAVAGLLPPRGGGITFDGEEIAGRSPADTVGAGVSLMPGGRAVFPTLTVAENLRIGAWSRRAGTSELDSEIREALERFPILAQRSEQMAGNLSGGEQQMLSLAMTFLTRPRLLLIDELSLGLAPVVVAELLEVVEQLRAAGTTVLIVEQSADLALGIADRAYFLEKGEVRFEGPTEALRGRTDLLRSVFFGAQANGRATRPAAPARRPDSARQRKPVLQVSGLGVHFGGIRAVSGVDLNVDEHEIVGMIGPNGAGKTTVFDLVSGFLEPDAGTVCLEGRDVSRASPAARAAAGLGRLFQDSRLFPSMTVAENLAVALERHVVVRDYVSAMFHLPAVQDSEEDVAWTVADLVELMGLGNVRGTLARDLSTGTRRVVDLAMAVAHDPVVLLLDEPSSGLAQKETEAMLPLLRTLQQEVGCALLVVEHDMGLITQLSDRMLALEQGEVIAEGSPRHVVRDPRVVSSYLGDSRSTANGDARRGTGRPARRPVAAARR